MKTLHIPKLLLLASLSWLFTGTPCQAQTDTSAGSPILRLHYYNENNRLQYLQLESLVKKGKLFTPQANRSYRIYLDSVGPNELGKVVTDATGKANAILPPALKTAWDGRSSHTFIVKEGEEELVSDYAITKSKILIDTATADSIHTITVSVMKQVDGNWVPASDVEMKVGFSRLGGILSAGDEETYTTDSTGTVAVEVKKEHLPGDSRGQLVIAAKVDDNDELGNLLAEMRVSWGKPVTVNKHFFDQRTLWSTRFRAPYWLLAMAFSIVLGVWGTLLYLIWQFVRIRKLGRMESAKMYVE